MRTVDGEVLHRGHGVGGPGEGRQRRPQVGPVLLRGLRVERRQPGDQVQERLRLRVHGHDRTIAAPSLTDGPVTGPGAAVIAGCGP